MHFRRRKINNSATTAVQRRPFKCTGTVYKCTEKRSERNFDQSGFEVITISVKNPHDYFSPLLLRTAHRVKRRVKFPATKSKFLGQNDFFHAKSNKNHRENDSPNATGCLVENPFADSGGKKKHKS